MKKLILLAAAIFIGGSLAAAAPTTQPTTHPALPLTKVLIVPFKQAGDTSSHGWVGPAIQESLMTDVAGSPDTEAVALNHPLANGEKPEAVKAAKGVGASIVVLGSYQFSDGQLRVMGQAVDAASGKMLATMQAAGPVTDLFNIEAALGAELSGTLPQASNGLPLVTYGPAQTAVPYYAGAADDTAPSDVTAPQQTYPYAAQPYDYVAPTYPYVYPYAGLYPYYYAYPYGPYGSIYLGIGVPYLGSGGGAYHQHWYGYHGGGRR